MEFEHETPRAIAESRARGTELFFRRVGAAIEEVSDAYDVVVIDCPPQLGYLTLGALTAATGMLITIHPQMVDVASMSQFLLMTSDLASVIEGAGGRLEHDFLRYVVTRHDPNDIPRPRSLLSCVACSAKMSSKPLPGSRQRSPTLCSPSSHFTKSTELRLDGPLM